MANGRQSGEIAFAEHRTDETATLSVRTETRPGTIDLFASAACLRPGALWSMSAFDRNNVISGFVMGALPAIGGSAISILLGAFLVWGVISLSVRRFRFFLTPSDRTLAWGFTLFAAAILFTAVLGDNRDQIPRHTLWLVPFLSLWVVIPRFRASGRGDFLSIYLLGAIVGAVGAGLVGVYQQLGFGYSVDGGTGNRAVYGIMSLCLASLAVLGIVRIRKGSDFTSSVAVAFGLLAVVISLTRGVWLAAVPVMILALLFAPENWRFLLRPWVLLILVAGAIVSSYLFGDIVSMRLEETRVEISDVDAEGYSESIGERLRQWHTAWELFLESPLLGYGVQNRSDIVFSRMAEASELPVTRFSHMHNGYLTAAIDGGILVLSAVILLLVLPVIVAWRAPVDEMYRTRLFAALLVSVVYATTAMTQILFKHDIMDAFFIFNAIMVAVSIPPGVSRDAHLHPPS